MSKARDQAEGDRSKGGTEDKAAELKERIRSVPSLAATTTGTGKGDGEK